jgi:hypothetical protein
MASDADKRLPSGPPDAALNPFGPMDPEPAITCCGKAMEPRMAKARDKSGETSFVTVWSCLRCGRKTV